MISLICEIDGTHAVVVWNDLFHGEQVDRIPLIVRWRQDTDQVPEMTKWQHETMLPDRNHIIIDPPSKVHYIECEYSADDGVTWSAARVSRLVVQNPVIGFKLLGDLPEVADDLALVFEGPGVPVTLYTEEILQICSGAEFTMVMHMAPVMFFFLNTDAMTYVRSTSYVEIISVEHPRFYAIDGSSCLSKAYAPAMFAAFVHADKTNQIAPGV